MSFPLVSSPATVDLGRWSARRGWSAFNDLLQYGIGIVCLVLVALFIARIRPADAEPAETTIASSLSDLGHVFANAVDPVLPSILTALVALTVVQVIALAPRLVLGVARAAGSGAFAWTVLASAALIDPEEHSWSQVVAAVALGGLCVALSIVVVEFNPPARRARARSLRAGQHDMDVRSVRVATALRRPTRSHAVRITTPAKAPIAVVVVCLVLTTIVPGAVATSATTLVAPLDVSQWLPYLFAYAVYTVIGAGALLSGGVAMWGVIRPRRADVVMTIVTAIVVVLYGSLAALAVFTGNALAWPLVLITVLLGATGASVVLPHMVVLPGERWTMIGLHLGRAAWASDRGRARFLGDELDTLARVSVPSP